GQSNKMTGAHQTYMPLPAGERADPKLMGRMAANLQLLQAQYGPAMHEILDVKRWGGASGNFYMRPWVLDHYDLLKEMSAADPKKFELGDVRKLLFEKYIDQEFEIQARAQLRIENIDQQELDEMLKWPRSKKQKYRQA